MNTLQTIIENAWNDRALLTSSETMDAIREVISLLDSGKLRVAEPTGNGWQVNEWVKKAVVLYFPIQKMATHEVGIFEYHDKIPLKRLRRKRNPSGSACGGTLRGLYLQRCNSDAELCKHRSVCG